MITVNELRISDKNLLLDVEINSALCMTGSTCLITKIEIYNQTNYNSGTPLLKYDNINASEYSTSIPLDMEGSELHSTDLYFIKIYWDGTPVSDCPCGQDSSPENFAVYDKQLVYSKGMQYMRELTNCCADKNGAIDFILTQKYFDLSLNNGAIVDAINLWNKMMSNTSAISTNNCGCHA